jgi:hypothetical protein
MTSRVSVIQGGDAGADVETFDESAVIFDKGEPKISAGMRYANGEASQGTFLITDDSAGRDEWAKIRGNCAFTWTEDASGCPIWLSRGRIKQVAYGRGVQRAGFAIEATATVDDANADLRQLPFTENWVRPEETDTERIYALQPYILNGFDSTSPNIRGTTDITITDSHLAPDTHTITMPAKTYPIGTMPQEVIDDCASTAGKVYGVVIHHGPAADTGAVAMGWSDIPIGSSSAPHWVFAGTLQKSVTVAGSSGVPVVEDTFAQNSASGADPVSNFAVGAGLTDRAFVVAFANYDRDGAASSVTWKPNGGDPPEYFTRVGTPIVLAGTSDGIYPSGIRLDVWYLLNPTDSDGTTSVLEAFFATGHPSATGVWLLSGVDQSSPISYAASTISDGTTTISTDVGGTGLALDAIAYRDLWNETLLASADVGQTEDFDVNDNNGFGNMAVALQGSHKEVAGSDECSHLCLLYIQETDNTTFATTVKISDQHDEVNPDASPPVYFPVWDQGPAANADSENLLSAMLSRYGSGDKTIYIEDAGRITLNDYAAEVYNDDRSVNVTQATARANGILLYRENTHYTEQVSVIVRPEQTDLICAGMSIQIKASAGAVDPGPYETKRIAELKWEPAYDDTVGFFYWAHMNLDRTPRNSPPSQGGVQPIATSDAEGAKYDNTSSGLAAGNVQDAVDEIASFLDGGSTGEVLTKLSGTDYDMDWEPAATGGHIIEEDGTPLTARANLNFAAGLVASDAGSGPDATDVDIDDAYITALVAGGFVTTTGGGTEPVQAHGNLGSTETIDLADGDIHSGTLNANCTLTFTGFVGPGGGFALKLTQDGTGGWDTTFPASVVNRTALSAALDQTASSYSWLVFVSDDTGASYTGYLAGGGGSGSVTFGTPALTLGTSNAAGSIDEVIRRDATILAFDATVPVTQAFSDAAATGAATVAARRDHKHGMPASPGGMTNPMTTAADLIVGDTGGTAIRLPKGSDSQVLTVDPTTHLLVWATPSSGFSDPMTTRGDIIIRNASNATDRLGRGSASTVLKSDGTDIAYGLVLPASLDVSADNTTADSTTGHHGLLPKLGGGSVNYLRADGTWATPSGSATFTGQPVAVGPPVYTGLPSAGTNSTANLAWAMPIIVPGTMLVRGLTIDIVTSAAGSIQWGLFDYSASISAATLLAGGTSAPGGTGYRSFPATSAPVTISAGAYMLVLLQPSATVPSIRCITAAGSAAIPWNQVWTSYTWDTTPDFSSASWVANPTVPVLYLEGDIDGSGNRWT